MAPARKEPSPASPPNHLSPADQMSRYLRQAEATVQQAKRGKKSLTGNNTYADRFHEYRTLANRTLRELRGAASAIADPGLERTMIDIEKELTYFFSPKTSQADRRDLRRHIEMLIRSEIEPAVHALTTDTAEFLPMEIVAGSRGYVENVARQVNVCFQHDALDACGVMVRRLLETLIIEVFEKKGLADRVKDGAGNYLMFTDLVSRLINTPEAPVGKTTRSELPRIAVVLNNCAHSRAFNISRAQLVQHQTVIVIATQELMNLWEVRGSARH